VCLLNEFGFVALHVALRKLPDDELGGTLPPNQPLLGTMTLLEASKQARQAYEYGPATSA
jgi:hypothetical protein